jgi:hypothetical protein
MRYGKRTHRTPRDDSHRNGSTAAISEYNREQSVYNALRFDGAALFRMPNS